MLYLKKLSPNDSKEIYEILQEIDSNENGFQNKVKGMSYTAYETWIKNEYEADNGKLKGWMVPQSTFWLYDELIPVGYGRLRHFLNDNLRETSGHIGYAIAKSKRGNGYGNKILELLIDEGIKLGIIQLQIGANENNELSNKVIKHNCGILFRTNNGKNFYYIDIAK